jgi:hypothetical protein
LRFSEISPEEKKNHSFISLFFWVLAFFIVSKGWTIFCHKFNDLENKRKIIEIK